MFYDYLDRPSLRFFGGGGGKPKKPKAPVEEAKTTEVRRIDDSAGEARKDERRRIPGGRKSTLKFGIQKTLSDRLGL